MDENAICEKASGVCHLDVIDHGWLAYALNQGHSLSLDNERSFACHVTWHPLHNVTKFFQTLCAGSMSM